MKQFKLKKDKWYFQSLWETKSVKEVEDWAVEISWYASTKDKDRWWDVVEPKAFASALERYMTNPIVLLQHKADKPIWVVEEANIDDNWLYIKAKISQNTDWVVDLIKNGVLRAFSIWYSIKDYDTDVRELADGSYDYTNVIKDLELYEISVVSIPMNPYALSKSIEDMFEIEEKEADLEETENPEKCENEEAKDTEKCEEENTDTKEWVVEWINAEDDVEVEDNEEKIDEEYQAEETTDWWVAVEVKEEENQEEKIVADEQSEISDEVATEESSENAVETTADDEAIDETSNSEVVETKSINTESQKEFDFDSKMDQLSKSFNERLDQKDEEIKNLKSKVENMSKLFAESMDTIDKLVTTVKNTPTASWLSYKRPLKRWGYYDVAEAIKSL